MAHLPQRSGLPSAPVPAIVQAPPTLNNAPSNMRAVTTILSPVGTDSFLVSFVSPHVAIHVWRHKCFITISPRNRRSHRLLDRVVTTLDNHLLHVDCVSIILCNYARRVYSLHCQAGRDAELLRNNLYAALMRIVYDFAA